ncbi:DUF1636 domain-containing protein [Azospirillum endophyticum]
MPETIVCILCCEPAAGPAVEPESGWTGAMFAALFEGVLASVRNDRAHVDAMLPPVECRGSCLVHFRSPRMMEHVRMEAVLGGPPPARSAIEALVAILEAGRLRGPRHQAVRQEGSATIER